MERLTELKELQNVRKFITLNSVNKTILHKMFNDVFDKLATYEQMEAEGRLHIAPCADGTPIWIIETDEETDENCAKENFYTIGFIEYHHGELGKDWFLNKEEAEQALEGTNDD